MTTYKGYVMSVEIINKTVLCRTQSVTYIRGGDEFVQMVSELWALCKDDGEKLLRREKLLIQIPPDYSLAIKADSVYLAMCHITYL